MTDTEPPRHVEAVLDAPGESCATLTPRIREAIRHLTSGAVLEIRTDDLAAREGVPAWSRLTGNPLIATVHEEQARTRFFVRKR